MAAVALLIGENDSLRRFLQESIQFAPFCFPPGPILVEIREKGAIVPPFSFRSAARHLPPFPFDSGAVPPFFLGVADRQRRGFGRGFGSGGGDLIWWK